MEVTLLAHQQRIKKNVEQDHYWYDAVQKKMLYGRGGQMIFVYDRSQKRTVPRIIDADGSGYENSYPTILLWIDKNKNRFGISVEHEAPNYYVTIQINAHQWDDISHDLYLHRIATEFDDAELERESKWN